MNFSPDSAPAPTPERFRTTRWTTVLRAGRHASQEDHASLERLCRDCWWPVYFFIRRLGHNEHDARDLTQGFFAHFLEHGYLRAADPTRGRFRSFLMASVKHFLAHDWEKAQRLKRGGSVTFVSWEEVGQQAEALELSQSATPEESYDRLWALALLQRALTRLREEFERGGKAEQFEAIKKFLSCEAKAGDYETVAGETGMTVRAVTVAVSRLRQLYAELAREEVANTVEHPEDMEDELRYLVTLAGA
jgi:RNA polymerase sigma-70 factor (ECF subfamily)